MKHKGIRIVCLAATLGIAVVSTAGLIDSGTRQREEHPAVLPAETTAETVETSLAVYDADPVQVSVCAEDLTQGDTAVLYDVEGNEVQTLTFAEDGQVATSPLTPGVYSLEQADIGVVTFTVRNNASIGAVSGQGWTDGELLYLDAKCRGNLCLTVARQPAEETVVSYNLCQSEQVRDGCVLLLSPDTTEKTWYFYDLTPGTYTLEEDGKVVQAVRIPADGSTVTVRLS